MYMQLAKREIMTRESWNRVLLIAVSCTVYFFQSLAWPLSQGRDARTYLIYYLDMWNPDPMYPMLMLFRTPLAPLFQGIFLQVGGSALLEIVMGALFCISILAVYHIGSQWDQRIGLLAVIATALLPGYGALYHSVSSDGLFAFAFILWVAYVFNTIKLPTLPKFAWHGIFVSCLVLIRPSSQLLLLFAGLPFALPYRSIRKKLLSSLAFLITSGLLLFFWSTYNYVRYGDFTVSRSTWAQLPLHRLFIVDRLIKPDNGPASAELAEAVRSDLLTKEPYVSYGIDVDTFFSGGSVRMWSDLIALSDRLWGWDSDYRKLRDVSLEAIARHPLTYSKNVAQSMGAMLLDNYRQSASRRTGPNADGRGTKPPVNERGLPVPTEGDSIPGSYLWWLASTPDNRIKYASYDWKSWLVSGPPRLPRFEDPQLQSKSDRLEARVEPMLAELPSRDGSDWIAGLLNRLAGWYPPMLGWIAMGMLGFVLERGPQTRTLAFMVGLAFVILLVTCLGIASTLQYRIPFDSLFIVFGMVGVAASLEWVQGRMSR
jgi:hypothetical protein